MDPNYALIDVNHEYASALGYVVSSSAENVGNYLANHSADHDRIAHWFAENVMTVCVLRNVNVDEDQRGKGYGNDALDEFIQAAGPFAPIILISDKYEGQEEGFELDKWYEGWGFSKVTSCASGAIMVFPEDIAKKMTADIFPELAATFASHERGAAKPRRP